MKLKKLFVYGLMTAMLTGVFTQTKAEAYEGSLQYESEDNNDYETANYIELGDSVTGNLSERYDVDYYTFSPSSDGQITLDFCHTYSDSGHGWKVSVYVCKSGEYTEISCTEIALNANERVSLPYIGAVQGGIYYIKVESNYNSDPVEVDYTINTIFKASDYFEKELNDSYSSATTVELNQSYAGTINKHDDRDYYKIIAPENGKITIGFNHTYEDSYNRWKVYVYAYENGEYTELNSRDVKLNENEQIQLPYIGAVKAGIYYLKIEEGYGATVVGKNYTVQIGFTESDYFEKERNDVYSTATAIELNHSYSGTINNTDDKDYYKIIAPDNGVITLDFNHTYENSSDDWNVYLYRYSNGEYRELSSMNVDLNGNTISSLGKVGVVKNGIYYIKVERCCSGVIGKNYSLKVKFSTNAPSKLKAQVKNSTVKLTWSKASGATGYEIYCRVGKTGSYKKIAVTAKNSYSYKKLAKGKTYYFKIRAYKKTGTDTYYSSYVTKSVKRK